MRARRCDRAGALAVVVPARRRRCFGVVCMVMDAVVVVVGQVAKLLAEPDEHLPDEDDFVPAAVGKCTRVDTSQPNVLVQDVRLDGTEKDLHCFDFCCARASVAHVARDGQSGAQHRFEQREQQRWRQVLGRLDAQPAQRKHSKEIIQGRNQLGLAGVSGAARAHSCAVWREPRSKRDFRYLPGSSLRCFWTRLFLGAFIISKVVCITLKNKSSVRTEGF